MSEKPLQVEHLTDEKISAIHQTLRASRRRLAVVLILNHSTPTKSDAEPIEHLQDPLEDVGVIDVRLLAKEIVAIEEDVSLDQATGREYHNVYTALLQTHLPRLDDVGAISFDSDRKTIQPDQNLVAMAAVAGLTSPIAQQLLHGAIADLYSGGRIASGSISD